MYATLKEKKKLLYLWVSLLGISNSLLNGALLIFINNAITHQSITFLAGYEWLCYLGLLIIAMAFNKLFQTYVIRVTYDMLFEFETTVVQKIRQAPFSGFDQLGTEKVYTALTDSRTLSYLPAVIVNTVNAFVMILCSIAYFFYIYIYGALLLLGVMALLLLYYLKRNAVITDKLNKARSLSDGFYEILNDLINGFKEVKMSSVRNRNIYHQHLLENRTRGRDLGYAAGIDYLNNELMGRFSWFFVIGVIMFLFPILLQGHAGNITNFLIVILYLIGPVNLILSMVSYYGAAKISWDRLRQFEVDIIPETGRADLIDRPYKPEVFESIRFEKITYEYVDPNTRKGFRLGPIDLSITAGEIIFITGSNGSGKSTFFNILTGLITPDSGDIIYNGRRIQKEELQHYRNQIAAIFTTPYLFSRNYDDYSLEGKNPDRDEWIRHLSMEEFFREDQAPGPKKMSKGQQKRLAMIYALLENKPVVVMDEWAAEQDPDYRAYFYTVLLHELRKKHKTIIAVTHDDRYFNEASRVLKFEFGNIILDTAAQPLHTAHAYIH